MKKLSFVILALMGLSVIPESAQASTWGYSCFTFFMPSASTRGNYGYAAYTLYSGPSCSGTYLGYFYICSTGATSNVCTQSGGYHFNSDQLISQVQGLRDATLNGQRLWINTFTCNGGASTNCSGNLEYHAP